MSVSIKNLNVGDVLKLKAFPATVYVAIADDSRVRLLNMASARLVFGDDDQVDHFLQRSKATKVGTVSTLWKAK